MVTQLKTNGKKRFVNHPKILSGKELCDELRRVAQSWSHNYRCKATCKLTLSK